MKVYPICGRRSSSMTQQWIKNRHSIPIYALTVFRYMKDFPAPKWTGYSLGGRKFLGEMKDINAYCLYRESNPNFFVFQPAV